MAIVCDRCLKKPVDKDGDICMDCIEELRPRTVLDYLKAYLVILEDFENRFTVTDQYITGLKGHIENLIRYEEDRK